MGRRRSSLSALQKLFNISPLLFAYSVRKALSVASTRENFYETLQTHLKLMLRYHINFSMNIVKNLFWGVGLNGG